jgi:hypothetical protein
MARIFGAVALVVLLGTFTVGCGNDNAAGANGGVSGSELTEAAPMGDPSGAVAGAMVASPAPSAPPAKLEAEVSKVDQPTLFTLRFYGTATAHVKLTNPSSVTLSGTVTVQFFDGEKAYGEPQTKTVEVGAGKTQEIEVSYKGFYYHKAAAKATIETTTPAKVPATAPATAPGAPAQGAAQGAASGTGQALPY